MRHKMKLFLGICSIIGLTLIVKFIYDSNITTSVFKHTEVIFNPYLLELEPNALDNEGREYEGIQENRLDYINYYIQSVKAINYMLDYKLYNGNKNNLKKSEEILENLKSTYDRCGCFPRPEYQNFRYGWVSSMDAPTIMLASQMLFELTGNKKWSKFVDELSEYISKDVKDGGFTIYFKNSEGEQAAWPLEYAEKSSTTDNSEFVLNGSLVGYLGVKLIANVTDNDDLHLYTKQVKKAYKDYFPKYHYKDYGWTYYMLNPYVVNQPHYMIFEKQLFNAIKEIDNASIFEKECLYRETVLKNVLKPQFKKENRGGGILFVIRRACAPHPYLIDIYPTKIEFMDDDDNILQTYANNISGKCKGNHNRFEEGQFLEGTVPEGAVKYTVYAQKTTLKEETLFTGLIELKSFRDTITYKIMPTPFYDATYTTNNLIKISSGLSEKSEARLSFDLPEIENKNMDNYYAIELDNLSNQVFESGAILYDSEGNGASRYYTELLPGKNLIILNEAGFSEINYLKNISNVTIRIYTSTESGNIEILPGNLYIFENIFDLKDYLNKSEYHISPQ